MGRYSSWMKDFVSVTKQLVLEGDMETYFLPVLFFRNIFNGAFKQLQYPPPSQHNTFLHSGAHKWCCTGGCLFTCVQKGTFFGGWFCPSGPSWWKGPFLVLTNPNPKALSSNSKLRFSLFQSQASKMLNNNYCVLFSTRTMDIYWI